ncbi:MAG: phosphate/phosphite/phosphonate ABC transporter substrate-binding protein [Gammaproteobacteria bacterium]|nr:phosphate/phosphite/phosphonate ABC transporter substrate-binding protein [Gammaproteobacteria bacterium]MCW8987598.1 phosphate/phosphite/phosphonate ABC transporter substrate-binding protein [Gammaproteobacteria bacterium]
MKQLLSKLTFLWIVTLSSTLLLSCDQKHSIEYEPAYSSIPLTTGDEVLIIGVHPLHNPKRLHEVFGPIVEYLSQNISGVNFKIEASRNYAAYDKKLYSRKFHFALPNPFQTVNSLKHGYNVFAKMSDDENFRGIFLVRKDSHIKKVTDLKGHAVSFPAPTALAATLMPLYYLQQHGLNVRKDIDIKYVGSQESSIMNVMLGNTTAGTTWLPSWRVLSKERPELAKELRVAWKTAPLPNNGLVARDDVDEKIVSKVKELLLNLHQHKQGQQWLAKMELSKFEIATNDTYEPVVDFLKRFNKEVMPLN